MTFWTCCGGWSALHWCYRLSRKFKMAQRLRPCQFLFCWRWSKIFYTFNVFAKNHCSNVWTMVPARTTMAWSVCLYFVTLCTGRCLLNCTVIGSGRKSWHKKKKKSDITICIFFIDEWHGSPDVTAVLLWPLDHTFQAHKLSQWVSSEQGLSLTPPRVPASLCGRCQSWIRIIDP